MDFKKAEDAFIEFYLFIFVCVVFVINWNKVNSDQDRMAIRTNSKLKGHALVIGQFLKRKYSSWDSRLQTSSTVVWLKESEGVSSRIQRFRILLHHWHTEQNLDLVNEEPTKVKGHLIGSVIKNLRASERRTYVYTRIKPDEVSRKLKKKSWRLTRPIQCNWTLARSSRDYFSEKAVDVMQGTLSSALG